MDWFYFFLKDLIPNRLEIFYIFSFLLALTLVGIIFFGTFLKERKLEVVVPGGMVAGTALYILYLGIFSHLFKGSFGIWIISLSFILSGIFLFRRKRSVFNLKSPPFGLKTLGFYVLVFLTSLVIIVKTGNAQWGGDAITYWGLATSFANGNYPQLLPWQPQFLTVHHQGAFLIEGAIHAVTGVDIRVVHFLFAAFIIFAGFSLLWGLVNVETKRPILSILAPLMGYIVFGGIFIPFLKSLGWTYPQVTILILPTLHDAKNALGALTSFFDLYYLVPRTTALAIIIFIFSLIRGKFLESLTKRILVVSILSSVVLSVDESMFAVIVLPILFWVLYELIKSKERKRFLIGIFIPILVFVALFWIVGNPIRDSLLTPSPEAPRFRLIGISEIVKQGRIGFLKGVLVFSQETPSFVWYLPDIRILLGITFLLSIFWGGSLSILFFLSALDATILYFLVEHTFWGGNYARFLLLGYLFNGFAMGTSIIKMFDVKRLKFASRFLGIALLVTVFPSILTNSITILRSLPDKNYSNFSPLTPRYKVLDWVKNNLPYNAKLFFIDGFLNGTNYSELTLHGIQGYGLFVPISSASIKMHTAEFGVEAIDIINTLSPKSMKNLRIQYLYIKSGQTAYYSEKRQADIANPGYFVPVYQDNQGILYKVQDDYFINVAEEEGTINKLTDMISNGSKIYIDSVPNINFYIRSALFLALRNKGSLYSLWGPGHYNYVETFIRINLPSPLDKKYDYLILGQQTPPQDVCKCRNFQLIWESNGAKTYRVY